MSEPASDPTSSRRRPLVWIGLAAVLGALVVGGLLAANRGTDTDTTSSLLGSGIVTPAGDDGSAAGQPADSESAAPTVSGKGAPIALSGNDPITGKPVDLASFAGKPVVLQIWASWCPGCNEEAPHVSELAKRRTDVSFVGLNFRDSRGPAKGFYERYGWTFPSIEDTSGDRAFGLGLQGTPTTIFLDSKLREIGRIVGAVDADSFEQAVDTITA